MEGLLHPIDAQRLEGAGDGGGVLQGPRRLDVPRLAPALIAVDHQLEAVAQTRPHGLQGADVVAPVAPVEAHLHGGKALGGVALGGVRQ